LSAAILSAVVLAACSDHASNGNPAAPTTPTPTPTPTATVRAVVVTSAATTPTNFQLNARADMSDGGSRDVTMLAKWESLNPTIATVSAAGVLTVVGSGQVDVRATYENVAGSISLLVSGPPRPTTFTISGVAIETPPSGKVVSGVVVQVTEGPDAGLTATTDQGGLYRFAALRTAPLTLEARKSGYLLWRVTNLMLDRDRQLEIVLFPTPPKNADGVDATARCNDSTWSWAQTRAEACAANGGIAYTICPGPLCELKQKTQ
jgi:hypothetical protein